MIRARLAVFREKGAATLSFWPMCNLLHRQSQSKRCAQICSHAHSQDASRIPNEHTSLLFLIHPSDTSRIPKMNAVALARTIQSDVVASSIKPSFVLQRLCQFHMRSRLHLPIQSDQKGHLSDPLTNLCGCRGFTYAHFWTRSHSLGSP